MKVNMRRKFGTNARKYVKCLAETMWTYCAGALAARPLPWDHEQTKGPQYTHCRPFLVALSPMSTCS